MVSKWRFIPTALIFMIFMVMGGCGSGSGSNSDNGSVINLNASGPTFTVSGTATANGVALRGVSVTVSGSAGSYVGVTDSSGKYTIAWVKDGNYTARPALAGYTFTPDSQAIVVNGANAAIDPPFTATAIPTFTVSGTVTANSIGLNGVVVTLSGSGGSYTGTSDSSGKYAITGVRDGSYTATPVLFGYSFTPQYQAVVVNGASATTNEFTATVLPAAGVYVVAQSAGSVLRINANTLAVEKTINLGVELINSIAVIGDTLWYFWGDQWGHIGRYDLITGANQKEVIDTVYFGLLRAAQADPGILYVGMQRSSPGRIMKFNIAVDPPVLLDEITDAGSLGDFKISADGSKIWSGSGGKILETRTSDMELSGTTFATANGIWPKGIDRTTVNGIEVLVGACTGWYEKDIYVVQSDDPSMADSYEISGLNGDDGNVAISKNASKVYSVYRESSGLGELITLSRQSGIMSSVPISVSDTFNSGIGIDHSTGRVFVATENSVSVFDAAGKAIKVIASVAGASTILVVAP